MLKYGLQQMTNISSSLGMTVVNLIVKEYQRSVMNSKLKNKWLEKNGLRYKRTDLLTRLVNGQARDDEEGNTLWRKCEVYLGVRQ